MKFTTLDRISMWPNWAIWAFSFGVVTLVALVGVGLAILEGVACRGFCG